MVRKDRVRAERTARVVFRDGREEVRKIGREYIPAFAVIPEFATARVFLGIDQQPSPILYYTMVLNDEARLQDPAVHQVAVRAKLNLRSFARMLSKIALGMAHYGLGPNVFEPVARDFIRFGDGHLNHFVGGYAHLEAPVAPAKMHHMSLWHHQGFLVATIQLFAWGKTPVNYAVVGRLLHMPPGLPPLPLG